MIAVRFTDTESGLQLFISVYFFVYKKTQEFRYMTKIAVMSEIHSNTEALSIVLAKCLELGIEEYAILGDIVGYNAEPAECIALVRELNIIGRVRGNHDEYAGNVETGVEGFNENAHKAVL